MTASNKVICSDVGAQLLLHCISENGKYFLKKYFFTDLQDLKVYLVRTQISKYGQFSIHCKDAVV